MIVLDSNVISALMRSEPDVQALTWIDAQPAESIWTTSVCVFEIRFGIQILVPGKRRAYLDQAFTYVLNNVLAGRILNFDAAAATTAAELAAEMRPKGLAIETRDLQIAAICRARHAVLATHNTKHFLHAGIELMDPWAN